MAKSHYNGEWIGKTPMCALCGGAGEGPRAEHRLTHGITVWLCEAHRSGTFQRRRAGRDFVASLAAVWQAAGVMSRRHSAALDTHLRRVRQPQARRRPGSYAWPHLREEAERRFAAGERPASVIDDLLGRARSDRRAGPSARTLRRWLNDGRWLATDPRTAPRSARGQATASAAARPVAGHEPGHHGRPGHRHPHPQPARDRSPPR